MKSALHFVMLCLDPLYVGRKFIISPLIRVIYNLYEKYRLMTTDNVNSLRDIILRLGLLAFAVALIIWTAVFMYAAFYYVYMPPISHVRPVHMQFKACADSTVPCTFPNAHVSLSHKHQQFLAVGQSYRVVVKILMPESPQNLNLGMFMVCAQMRDSESVLRDHSCRSAMMRYRSPLIRTISTWVLSPLYILGFKEEYQEVAVEVFSQYLEQQQYPLTDVYVEIKSQQIQFYAVSLHIIADFTGLRYIMYNQPLMSAIIGVSTNLFFILIIFVLSWYHWSDFNWLLRIQYKYNRITETLQQSGSQVFLVSKNTLHDDDLLFPDDEKTLVSEIRNTHGIEEQYSSPMSSHKKF